MSVEPTPVFASNDSGSGKLIGDSSPANSSMEIHVGVLRLDLPVGDNPPGTGSQRNC